jgi:glycosyltransferase involved in cell wall biosynthesis
MTCKEKISVLMPAFNEGHHIYQNGKETFEVFRKFAESFEILIINDGSSDNTKNEITKLQTEYSNASQKILLVDQPKNAGKGAALKKGFEASSGEIIIFLDADLDLPPHQIEYLIDLMKDNSADVVIGSKQHPHSNIDYPKRRKLLSWVYSKVLLLLFGLPLRDTQTGLKLFKRNVLADIFPVILSKAFAYDVEILANAHHLGYKILEAPIILNFRSMVRWGTISRKQYYQTANDTLAVFYRLRILKYYDKVRAGTIAKIN